MTTTGNFQLLSTRDWSNPMDSSVILWLTYSRFTNMSDQVGNDSIRGRRREREWEVTLIVFVSNPVKSRYLPIYLFSHVRSHRQRHHHHPGDLWMDMTDIQSAIWSVDKDVGNCKYLSTSPLGVAPFAIVGHILYTHTQQDIGWYEPGSIASNTGPCLHFTGRAKLNCPL